MDFLSSFATIAALSALLPLIYSLYKAVIFSQAKSEKIGAPEPPGAWPLIGHLHLLGGSIPIARKLGALADSHGPVFALRLSCWSHALVVSSWEAVKDCFTTNDKVFATRPDLAVARRIGYNRSSFALSPHGAHWSQIRKMATTELLSNARLEAQRRVKASVIDSYIKQLHAWCSVTEVVPVNSWFERLAISLTVRLVTGRRFSVKSYDETGGEAARLRNALKQTLYLSGLFIPSDVIPLLEWLDYGGHLRTMDKTFKELDSLLQKWVDQKKKKEGINDKSKDDEDDDDNDFMDTMLSKLKADSTTATHHHELDIIVKATTLTLILTGTESMSLTLTWALSLLLNNPNELRKAQVEIDEHVGQNRWVQESDIKDLKYLHAVVKEVLRLYPPAPLSGPREAMQDCFINGYYVPKGTRLIVNMWKLQRDPKIWDRSNDFFPDRFLKEHIGMGLHGQDFEYIPFSSGRRSCPAINYAMQIMLLTLARLIQGFNMATPGGLPVDMREGVGVALPKVETLNVVLSPRLMPELYL